MPKMYPSVGPYPGAMSYPARQTRVVKPVRQGATVSSPFSRNPRSLGRPKSQKRESAQGQTQGLRPVTQGKFTGNPKWAKNTKQRAPEAAPATAWPNKGTVHRGRIRGMN